MYVDQSSTVKRNERTGYYSAGESLWNTVYDDQIYRRSVDRLNWAIKNLESKIPGVRANALNICARYYDYGWSVKEDSERSKRYLREAAELGHGQACYDLARSSLYLDGGLIDEAEAIIKVGLNHINDESFNCRKDDYVQKELEVPLQQLLLVCKFKRDFLSRSS